MSSNIAKVVLMALAFGGCSEQSFKSGASAPQKQKSTGANSSGNAQGGSSKEDLDVDRGEVPLCGDTPQSLNFSIGPVSEPFNGSFSTWVYYSQPFTVDLRKTEGLYLPVTQYSVDDLLLVIGENETINVSGGTVKGETVTFNFPNGAKALSSSSLPGGQYGKMGPSNDVFSDKIYVHNGKRILLPRSGLGIGDVRINDLIPLGMPVVNYDKLSLRDLRDAGYVGSDDQLRIKLAMIPHGGGALTFKMDVKACQP